MDDKERNITLNIAGKLYPLKTKGEEHESQMRFAAEDVTKMLEKYNVSFPAMSTQDKLVFVALNQAMTKLKFQRAAEAMKQEFDAAEADLSDYLDKLETDR